MKEILDESALPKWLAETLDNERWLFPDSELLQKLGAAGYKVYHIKDNWYGWDNGTAGCLISDGRIDKSTEYVCWICVDDLFPNITHPHYTSSEIDYILQQLPALSHRREN